MYHQQAVYGPKNGSQTRKLLPGALALIYGRGSQRHAPTSVNVYIYKESPYMWKYSAKYLTLSYKFKELDRKMKLLVSAVQNITEQWELTEINNVIVEHNFIR